MEARTRELVESQLLFHCTRELLMNVAKQANTDRATIPLTRDAETLSLRVSDKGRGFSAATIPTTLATDQSLTQFGLSSIRERMEPLCGRFDVRSGPNQGTRASLILPLAQEDVPLPRQTILPEQGSTVGMKPRDAGTTLRRLLIDDHAMVREGLRGVLDGYADIQVVGEQPMGKRRSLSPKPLSLTSSSWTSFCPRSVGSKRSGRLSHADRRPS